MERDSYTHYMILFLLVLIAANLLILDLKVFSQLSLLQLSDTTTVVTPIPSTAPESLVSSCLSDCRSLIEQATKSAQPLLGAPNQEVSLTTQTIRSSPREYYIPLGSGSTTKSSFEDLATTEAIIDPANYGTIKEAYFTASFRNPTKNGQVEAQLYNVTDKNIVWGSHVVMNGAEAQTITSTNFSLPSGAKLYRIQLKSTLQFQVFLDNAKIRIVTD